MQNSGYQTVSESSFSNVLYPCIESQNHLQLESVSWYKIWLIPCRMCWSLPVLLCAGLKKSSLFLHKTHFVLEAALPKYILPVALLVTLFFTVLLISKRSTSSSWVCSPPKNHHCYFPYLLIIPPVKYHKRVFVFLRLSSYYFFECLTAF